ncbi:MarR family transcriptional regulator [Nakamurella flavida]|uniref:MarR family transcriptional regulator n=1 Tax=Nakamurella flavida TaxID=363630 RepID=A0A939C1H7_9ACTN|nr:MarR family transcriptional regulator [Nakamurella flavida]MBM9477703.1 MarR family transcriptional regulator [Nakamurella flavida]MDP9779255.1 hypothetical protein [Nakamurella flavida]
MISRQPESPEPEMSAAVRAFVEDFADNWYEGGYGRMEGRVMAYLLISSAERVPSAELARVLGVAAGAVSMATRNLVTQGFIRRHRVPGDRSHYFAADDDIWGGFLSGERRWVFRMENVLGAAGAELPLAGAARHRVLVAREYMSWLGGYNQQMLQDWRAHLQSHVPPAEES